MNTTTIVGIAIVAICVYLAWLTAATLRYLRRSSDARNRLRDRFEFRMRWLEGRINDLEDAAEAPRPTSEAETPVNGIVGVPRITHVPDGAGPSLPQASRDLVVVEGQEVDDEWKGC